VYILVKNNLNKITRSWNINLFFELERNQKRSSQFFSKSNRENSFFSRYITLALQNIPYVQSARNLENFSKRFATTLRYRIDGQGSPVYDRNVSYATIPRCILHLGDTPLRGIPYAPSIFMGPSTYCQTYWASANGRGHARNSWIFKQVTKQSSFALAPAPGTDTPPGHQAVPYYLIAYWAEMELSYSVQLRARVRTLEPICDQESSEEGLTLSSVYISQVNCMFKSKKTFSILTTLSNNYLYGIT